MGWYSKEGSRRVDALLARNRNQYIDFSLFANVAKNFMPPK